MAQKRRPQRFDGGPANGWNRRIGLEPTAILTAPHRLPPHESQFDPTTATPPADPCGCPNEEGRQDAAPRWLVITDRAAYRRHEFCLPFPEGP